MDAGEKRRVRSSKGRKKGGRDPPARSAAEEARRREVLKETLREKLELERRARQVVERLLDDSVTEELLIDCARLITPANYKDAVEERSIAKMCGYPVCPNKLTSVPAQQYKISTKTNKVYDITERKCFCSNFCYKASKSFEVQISKSPLWLRKEERPSEIKLMKTGDGGSSGLEIKLTDRPVNDGDIENPNPEHSEHRGGSSGPSDSSDVEQDFVSSVVSGESRRKPRVHWGELPKRDDGSGHGRSEHGHRPPREKRQQNLGKTETETSNNPNETSSRPSPETSDLHTVPSLVEKDKDTPVEETRKLLDQVALSDSPLLANANEDTNVTSGTNIVSTDINMNTASSGTNVNTTSSGTNVNAASSGTNVNAASSGTNVNAASSGTNVNAASSGTNVNAASSGTNVNAASSGTNVNAASSGTNVNAASSGTNVNDASSGTNVNDASSGTNVNAASSGTNVNAASSGTNVNAASSGTNVNATSSGTNVNATSTCTNVNTTSGTNVNPVSSGTKVKATSSSTSVNAASSGTNVNATSSGTKVNAASAGTSVNATSTGTNVNATSSGPNVNAASSGTNVNATSSCHNVNAASPCSNINAISCGTNLKAASSGTNVNAASSGTNVNAALSGTNVNAASSGTIPTNVTSDTNPNISQVGMSKKSAAGLKNVLQNHVRTKTEVPAVKLGLLQNLRITLSEWRTEETMRFLYGQDFIPQPEPSGQVEEEEEELDEDDLEDVEEVAERVKRPAGGPARSTASTPDFNRLKKEAELQKLRVKEFYKGVCLLPEGAETEVREESDNTLQGGAKDPPLPPVDSHAQRLIQKRIAVEKLSRSLQDIVGPLRLTMNDVMNDLNNLVRTFRLTNTNIIHKPPEWTLIAVVLLSVLTEVSPLLNESMATPSSVQYISSLMKELQLEDQDLQNLVQLFRPRSQISSTHLH